MDKLNLKTTWAYVQILLKKFFKHVQYPQDE